METVAELQRAFLDGLYTFRIEVAVASTVGAIVAVAIAWRAGWFAAARRHPGRSGVLLVVVLAVALPMTYYLASPIWIRTELIEPDPLAVAVPVVQGGPGPSRSPSTQIPAPPAPAASAGSIASATPGAPRTIATGAFNGTDEFHFGRGTAKIVETTPGSYTLRLVDFAVRNGPDLYVYLSPDRDGYADGAVELGRLKATDGSFGYALPAGTNPADFASAIIWCKQFSHLFAVAPLATS